MPIAGAQKAIAVSSVPKERLGIDESFDFMGVILSGIHLSHDRRQLAIPHERYAAEAASQPSAKADAGRSTVPGLLPGRFMVIRQSRGCPKSRGEATARMLGDFVDKVWGHGFIADAMRCHDTEAASVAPAAERTFQGTKCRARYFLSARYIRNCQPSPVARMKSTTSRL